MTNSNRESILGAFLATLGNIKTLNGFSNTVTKVERKMLGWGDPQTTPPVLMVLGGGEIYDDRLGDKTVSGLKIKIRGYSKSPASPEAALNSLIRDVQICLDSSVYNPSYHKSFRPISLETDEGYLNLETDGMAIFEYVIEVIYKFSRSNP